MGLWPFCQPALILYYIHFLFYVFLGNKNACLHVWRMSLQLQQCKIIQTRGWTLDRVHKLTPATRLPFCTL